MHSGLRITNWKPSPLSPLATHYTGSGAIQSVANEKECCSAARCPGVKPQGNCSPSAGKHQCQQIAASPGTSEAPGGSRTKKFACSSTNQRPMPTMKTCTVRVEHEPWTG